MTLFRILIASLLISSASTSTAQTSIDLGGIAANALLPVEISADSLSVDQDTGKATFSGNVVIGQGDLRMSAGEVEVVYAEGAGQIASLKASGGATFVTATEAAEAETAEYNLETGSLILSGDVLLTQGSSAISAERMAINLNTGSAELTGRVRTIIQQSGN